MKGQTWVFKNDTQIPRVTIVSRHHYSELKINEMFDIVRQLGPLHHTLIYKPSSSENNICMTF